MKLRDWLTSSNKKQAKEPVEVGGLELDSSEEVLQSGYSLEELEDGIEEREDLINKLQRDISRHEDKKERAVERAKKAESSSDKQDRMIEAKEHKVLKEKKENILEHLQEEKLKLKKLQLQHLQSSLSSEQELDIDVSDLPVSDIEGAIEETGDEIWEGRRNMEDLDDAMDLADEEFAEVDITDIEEEVEGNSSGEEFELSDRSLETEDDIDQAIEQELEKIEDLHDEGL